MSNGWATFPCLSFLLCQCGQHLSRAAHKATGATPRTKCRERVPQAHGMSERQFCPTLGPTSVNLSKETQKRGTSGAARVRVQEPGGRGQGPGSLGRAVSCSRAGLPQRLQPPSRPAWGWSTELAAAAWASTL